MKHIREAAALYAKPKKKKTPETRLKHACTKYLKTMSIFSYPVTQGMGSYPGLPDRVAHYQGKVWYLEFKRPTGGRLSDNQKRFRAQCERDGIPYLVIRSIDDIERGMGIPTLFTPPRKRRRL